MIKFYSGGGKNWKIVGKTAKIQTDRISGKNIPVQQGKNPKYEIQEEILYQFLTLLIEILKKWHKYLPRCPIAKKTLDGIIK